MHDNELSSGMTNWGSFLRENFIRARDSSFSVHEMFGSTKHFMNTNTITIVRKMHTYMWDNEKLYSIISIAQCMLSVVKFRINFITLKTIKIIIIINHYSEYTLYH